MKWLPRAIDAINRAAFLLGTALIASIAAIYCYEVGARYLFNAPTEWSNVVGGFFLSAGTFLVIPEVTRRGAHVAVDILLHELGGRPRRCLFLSIMAVSGLLCAIACVVSAMEAWRQIEENISIMSSIIVPKWYVTVFMPFGFLGASYYFLAAAVTGQPGETREL